MSIIWIVKGFCSSVWHVENTMTYKKQLYWIYTRRVKVKVNNKMGSSRSSSKNISTRIIRVCVPNTWIVPSSQSIVCSAWLALPAASHHLPTHPMRFWDALEKLKSQTRTQSEVLTLNTVPVIAANHLHLFRSNVKLAVVSQAYGQETSRKSVPMWPWKNFKAQSSDIKKQAHGSVTILYCE